MGSVLADLDGSQMHSLRTCSRAVSSPVITNVDKIKSQDNYPFVLLRVVISLIALLPIIKWGTYKIVHTASRTKATWVCTHKVTSDVWQNKSHGCCLMKHFISLIFSTPPQDFNVSFYLMYVKCSRALYLHNFR